MTRISINLLGIERKEALSGPSIPIDRGWLFAAIFVVAAISLDFIAITILSDWKATKEQEKQNLEQAIKRLDAQLKEVKDLENQKKVLETEEKILLYVTGGTYKWSSFLEELRALMPLDLSIDNLKIDNSGGFTLTGSAYSHREVALFFKNIERSKMIESVNLQSSKKSPGGLTQFIMICKVNSKPVEAVKVQAGP